MIADDLERPTKITAFEGDLQRFSSDNISRPSFRRLQNSIDCSIFLRISIWGGGIMSATAELAKHTVPGQYLGYALQPVRLCYHLLSCPPGSSVSLETVEDVAVYLPNGHVILEQMKSALSHNPLSDWALDFWKTIGYWVSSGAAADPKFHFNFYVTPLKVGGLPKLLGDASSKKQVDEAIAAVQAALTALKKKVLGCLPDLKLFLQMPDFGPGFVRPAAGSDQRSRSHCACASSSWRSPCAGGASGCLRGLHRLRKRGGRCTASSAETRRG